MKRVFCLALCLTILLSCIMVGATAEELTFTPGTYTATVNGNVGPITVETVFSEHAIDSVTVVSHNETRIISTPAIERMPKAIVENQSLAVDAISSCTVTSNAILFAVRQCATEAGGDLQLLYAPLPEPEKQDRTIDADIVVVGGGLSGLTAAASAADSGKQVVLLEKLDATGGSSALSGGVFVAIGVEGQEELGATATVEEMVQNWMDRDAAASLKPYDESIDFVAKRTQLIANSAKAHDFLNAHGDTLNETPLSSNYWLDMPIHYYSIQRVDQTDTYDAGGSEHTNALTKYLEGIDNVTLYMGTPAKELPTKDGAICGVVAESEEGKLTINTSKVILACGGYARNGELLERFVPIESADFAPYSCSGVGNTGDGIIMAEAIGADVYEEGFTVTMGFPVSGANIKADINTVKGLLVMDAHGNRIVSYNAGKPPFITAFSNAYKETGAVYELHDANSGTVEILEKYLSLPTVFKADSLDELAELTGMDAETLKATVETYNSYCDQENDPDFGQKTLTRIDTAPFYATSHSLSNYATFGGLKTNENYEVLNKAGEPIEGLYAVGELTTGNVVNQFYLGGSMLLNSIVSGMLAGENASA